MSEFVALTCQILTWTAKRHQPSQSALRDAAPRSPTAAPGNEASPSFAALGGEPAARIGQVNIVFPPPPGTG